MLLNCLLIFYSLEAGISESRNKWCEHTQHRPICENKNTTKMDNFSLSQIYFDGFLLQIHSSISWPARKTPGDSIRYIYKYDAKNSFMEKSFYAAYAANTRC